jgi:hypothetical protein
MINAHGNKISAGETTGKRPAGRLVSDVAILKFIFRELKLEGVG